VGLISSSIYIGNILGCLLFPLLLSKLNAKTVIVWASLLNALSVGIFSLTDLYWALIASRVLAGLSQVVFVIYFPVWIDLCSPEKHKTMLISVFYLSVPLGLVTGFGLAGALHNNIGYRWSFMIETVLMLIPVTLSFMLVPASYFEKETGANDGSADKI
jgi:predicted MFS family arabinose efflux permease